LAADEKKIASTEKTIEETTPKTDDKSKQPDKRGIFDEGYGNHEYFEHHEFIEHPKIITKTIHVPQPYPVHIDRPVPIPIKVHVDRPYPVEVPKPYPVTVEKYIPVKVEKPIPYPVKVPVEVPVIHKVEVPVPKPYPVPVDKPYPVPVPHPIVVEKHVPVIIKEKSEKPEESLIYTLNSDISEHDFSLPEFSSSHELSFDEHDKLSSAELHDFISAISEFKKDSESHKFVHHH